ncbi:MAG: transporter substrate-binding domain-containing protein [Desulfobacterales bacterium]|nr:transporter substrate-binding domain-containing protein [Desulfobacterales bacterium]
MIAVLLALLFSVASATAEETIFLTCEEPPTNFAQEEQVVGISVDIVRELIARLGKQNDIMLLPWARAYKMALKRPNVILFTCGRTRQRADLGFSFIGPIVTRTHGLFSLKQADVRINSLDDVRERGIHVGGMIGDWRTESLMDKGISVQQVSTHHMNIRKLLHRRIDLMISSDLELPTLVRDAGEPTARFRMSLALETAPSFIMLSKDTPPAVVSAWEEALSSLKETDFMARTADKWSEILGLSLVYEPDKGIVKTHKP